MLDFMKHLCQFYAEYLWVCTRSGWYLLAVWLVSAV